MVLRTLVVECLLLFTLTVTQAFSQCSNYSRPQCLNNQVPSLQIATLNWDDAANVTRLFRNVVITR